MAKYKNFLGKIFELRLECARKPYFLLLTSRRTLHKLLVQHNLSFLTAEHLSSLYSKMIPDSKIARDFKFSRTKTTAILNEAISPS